MLELARENPSSKVIIDSSSLFKKYEKEKIQPIDEIVEFLEDDEPLQKKRSQFTFFHIILCGLFLSNM